MQNQLLHHMYQAWQQGVDSYTTQYTEFVSFASKLTNQSYDEMFNLLKEYSWFIYIEDK